MSGEEPGTGVDPDIDLAVPGQRRELADYGAWVLAVIGAGGVIGAELRWGAGRVFPTAAGGVPWTTLLVNVVGGLAMGVLMGLLGRIRRPHPLARPFFGVGILGGFTTFSTSSTDTYRLLDAGRPGAGIGYLVLTLLGALLATAVGFGAAGLGAGPR